MKSILFFVAAMAFSPMAGARLVQVPSYQELLEKSDLVVIAVPTASGDALERIDLPGITTVMAENKTVGFPVVGVETRFQVSIVLKGSKGLGNFVLHHYRQADRAATINGPSLVTFEANRRISFLLFLVREKDGRYAPTAGQTDPASISIHSLGAFAR
jgi:hypothetical protein